MKKTLKILLIIFFSITVLILGFALYFFAFSPSIKLDEKKLINLDKNVTYYYSNGEIMKEESLGKKVTEIDNIPAHVKNAFIAIEDKRFYSHNGVDYLGLGRAFFKNVKSFSLKEGASTITQQLIKNTHLSNEKTLKRKITEIKLSLELEKKFSKEEILEKYLNTIYFGDGNYGIVDASNYYFSKSPNELTVNESAVLASIVKAPSIYSPTKNRENCLKRKNLILKEMFTQDYITHNQYENSLTLPCEINISKNEDSHEDLIKSELLKILGDSPYYNQKIEVYTSINPSVQNYLLENTENISDKYSAVVLNSKNEIEGYINSGVIEKRQVGSTIKPIAVYAPAIEHDVVAPMTKILDEKQDFNGYNPSNFGNKYYGYVTVKESLEKSLNTCAVKILNDTGVDKARDALNKMRFPLTENDNSLTLALGATEKGATLLELTSCYNVFQNDGYYHNASAIKKITSNGSSIYEKNQVKNKVFSSETISLTNDMLLSTAKCGTAKKLSTLTFPVYAKTGTVGNKNGNTDAYCVSFDENYIIGVWLGNKNGEYLKNDITGGSIPTEISRNVWQDLYKDKKARREIPLSNGVEEVYLDKISLDEENVLIVADINAPERYRVKGLFKKSNTPKEISKRFSSPTLREYDLSVNSLNANISFKKEEFINLLIYREDNFGKQLICDYADKNTNVFTDETLQFNKEYVYSIVPYFNSGNEIFYGKEIYFDKIKTPPFLGGDDWWLKDDNE